MLEGIRILDLSRALAGPYGTLLLGDLGAEILKVEMPGGGDDTRTNKIVNVNGTSAYFISINRNKKSIVLDLKNEKGLNLFYELVKKSDVVYDNFRPGVVERLKLDYNTLKKIKHDIICCSISGYGHTGPFKDRPAFDLVIQAISGEMSITGEVGGAPVRMGVPMGDLAGGLFAAIAINGALVQRNMTGKGQKIDLSLLDTQISLLSYVAQYYLINGKVPQPIGSAHQTIVPYQAYKCKDNFIVVACFTEKFWPVFCDVLGRKDLTTDYRFVSRADRVKNRLALEKIVENVLAHKTVDEWLKLLDEANVPAGPINSVGEALSDPQVLARKMVVEMTDPEIGSFRSVGNPIKSTDLEKSQTYCVPPRLGQHTRQILHNLLGYDERRISRLIEENVVYAE